MTWDPPELVATGSAKASGTSLGVSFGGVYPAGTVLTLLAGFDNYASTTNPSVTPSQPGVGAITWTQHGSGAGQGAGITTSAGAGVWQRVWTGVVTADASGTINLTWSNAVVARAAALYALPGQAGAPTVRSAVVFGTSTGGAAAAAGGTAAQAGDLVLGYATSENNAVPGADTDTTNGSWDASLGGIATSGGSAVTNVAVGFQWKIATGTGVQTFNPAGSADSVAAILILVGVTVDNRNGTFALSGGGALAAAGRKAVGRLVALSGGGALVDAARKAVQRAAGALSGGGALAAAGGPPGIDAREGTFALSGGGSSTAAGRHGALRALTAVTGGGTPAAAGRKAVSRALGTLATGGGALAAAARHGALRALTLSGGGALASAGRKAGRAAVSLSGGGALTVSGSAAVTPKDASGTFALSGGGSQVATARKAVARTWAVTGGGALVVARRKGSSVQLTVQGGGTPALSTSSGRRAALTALSTGGALVATGSALQASQAPRAQGPGRTLGLARSGHTTPAKVGKTATLVSSGPGRTGGALL